MSRHGWLNIFATALFVTDAILTLVGGGGPYVLPIAFLAAALHAASHIPG